MGVVIGMFMRDHQIELSNLTLAYQDTGECFMVFAAAMPTLIK